MTMTVNEDAVVMVRARMWLQDFPGVDPAAVNEYSDFRVMGAVDDLYSGGWERFESDTLTVVNASEWELSW